MKRLMIVLVALALLATACGGREDADGANEPASSSSAEPAALASASVASPGADDAAFPVTIEHVLGTTVIPAQPERVVAYGKADHSFALALGVTPIAVRREFDAQTFRALPWAEALLGDAR